MALTNVPSDLAACKHRITPPSPPFFWASGSTSLNFSRDAPGRLVYLGLDVLLDALLDVLLVAVVATSSVLGANRLRGDALVAFRRCRNLSGTCGPLDACGF
jgi:hypothetical protein